MVMSSEEDADWDDEGEEEVYGLEDDSKPYEIGLGRGKSYQFLGPREIAQKQRKVIEELCEATGLSVEQAGSLLMKHEWCLAEVMQRVVDLDCFEVTQMLRTLSYLDTKEAVRCVLCYGLVPAKEMMGLECKHLFCRDCYTGYLEEAVNQGIECIHTTCPESSCDLVVSENMFKALLSQRLFDRYKRFVVNSYIDRGRNVKWCPRAGCEYACEYPKNRARDVVCLCGYAWCFKCGLEAHSPLDCETLTKWNAKNSSSDDSAWIKANTKTCPRCKNPIQKNEGCMHMTCRCGHQFCWLCLGDWSDHGSQTGGYYACNKFQQARLQGKYKQEERERFLAEQSVKRYEHYFNRYMEHKRAYRQAIDKNRKVKMEIINSDYLPNKFELQFVEVAVDLLVECRNVIANSYAYGYFLTSPAKLQFFEFLQGDMERSLERLDEVTDSPINSMIEMEPEIRMAEQFYTWKENVNGLVNSLSAYFGEIKKEILANFPDVRELPVSEEVLIEAQLLSYSKDQALHSHWTCPSCTFANVPANSQCQICQTQRPT